MMGLFGSSSPFDADVEKATSEKNTSEDWGLIMDVCDKVGTAAINAKDCLRSVMKRLNHEDPHVAIQAVTLLDACANNCGKNFHLEIASRDFETEFRKLLSRVHPTVQQKLKSLLKKWAEGEFKNEAQLNLIPSLYYKLRQEGLEFPTVSDTPTKKSIQLSKDPNVVSTQQEEDDIAKAIELSLKDKGGSPKTNRSTLYPSTNLSVTPGNKTISSEARKVRALYDFEAAEDNELTFKAGEIVHVMDDSDPNWWKGYNQRGEGLFPANFVTADLSVEPEQLKPERRKSVQFNEEVEVQTMPIEPEIVEINENKIDRLLHLLHEADPRDDQSDPKEMLCLEEQVNGMGPLIDTELERVDRKHAQLTQLSSDLVDALNLYHTLMREPPYQSLQKSLPFSNFVPPHHQMPNVYNGMPQNQQFHPPTQVSSFHSLPPNNVGSECQLGPHQVFGQMSPHGQVPLPPSFMPHLSGQMALPPHGAVPSQQHITPQQQLHSASTELRPSIIPNFAAGNMMNFRQPHGPLIQNFPTSQNGSSLSQTGSQSIQPSQQILPGQHFPPNSHPMI